MKQWESHFHDDQPIRSFKSDKLGRAKFSSLLADRISSWRGRNSLVIALMGEWGSGKTSVKNMIVERLQRRKNNRIDVLEFNPWMFSGSDSLSEAFFRELSNALGEKGGNSVEAKVRAAKMKVYSRMALLGGSAMRVFGKMIESLVPDNGGSAIALEATGLAAIGSSEVINQGAEVREAQSEMAVKSLVETKISLSREMEKMDRPLLVVVDDMDRLTEAEVRECVQLVKANADFPNIIYLLIFDRKAVTGALDAVSGGRGAAFLEKVVQVSFHVPQPSLADVHKILCDNLDRYLKLEGVGKRWDEGRWREMWSDGFRPFFGNLRTVYRFLSSLEFQIGQMRNGRTFELNPLDLIALEILRMFEPDLYDALPGYRAFLVGDHADRIMWEILSSEDKQKQIGDLRGKLLDFVSVERRKNVKVILQEIFPALFSEGSTDTLAMIRNLNVGVSQNFSRYFMWVVAENDVSQAAMDRFIESLTNPEEFKSECHRLQSDSVLDRAFERLSAYNEDLPGSFFPSAVTSLAEAGDFFPYVDWVASRYSDPILRAWRLIYFNLRKVDDEVDRCEMLLNGFSNSKGVRLVTYVAMRQERHPNNSGSNYIISNDHALKLRDLALAKIRQAAKDGRLRDIPDLHFILWRWSQWTEPSQETRIWVESQISTSNDAIWFLRAITSSMTSGSKVIRYVALPTVDRFADRVALTALTEDCSIESLSVDGQRALKGFRYALRWEREGKHVDYRGEHEKGGNPLAEEY